MTFMEFAARSSEEEIIDDPSIDAAELEETLDHLATINALLLGYGPSIAGVASLAGERRNLSLLDVGTGSADTPRKLARWASRQGIDLYIKGIDLGEVTVELARRRSVAFRNIDIEVENVFDLREFERYDVVHAALMLHHLKDDAAIIQALRKMYAISRLGVVINDLHRHRIGYLGSKILLPMMSKNRLIRHDGPLSVLRSFTREELLELTRKAGLPAPEIRWHPFFRWQLILRREA